MDKTTEQKVDELYGFLIGVRGTRGAIDELRDTLQEHCRRDDEWKKSHSMRLRSVEKGLASVTAVVVILASLFGLGVIPT